MGSSTRISRREVLSGAAALTLGGVRSQAAVQSPDGVDDAAWAAVREQFLADPKVAYLNNASLGMPPRQVVAAVAAGYGDLSSDPVGAKARLQAAIADEVVPGLARLLGAAPGEISLTRNATEALHLQSLGLTLKAGDEVLITTQEHPAGRRPWLLRAAREGVRVKEVFVPSPIADPGDVVARMEAAISPRTRAIAFCHVTRGGHLYPVRALCELAARRGLASLVDGAQAVGQFPVDLHAMGCDAYSASLHKWLLGPAGTGVLYVRAAARDRIASLFAHDATTEEPAYAPPGTPDFPVRAGLAAAIGLAESLTLPRIEARCRYLSDALKTRLAALPGVTILSGATRDTSAPGSTIFEVTGLDALKAVPLLAARGLHIDEHQRDGHNAIRVSTHIYNSVEEIERLVRGITQVR